MVTGRAAPAPRAPKDFGERFEYAQLHPLSDLHQPYQPMQSTSTLISRALRQSTSALRRATAHRPAAAAATARFASTSSEAEPTAAPKTHYLLTLLRSPLHLPKPLQATCQTLGLTHRLQSSIIPISAVNSGLILRVKELVGVRQVGVEEISKGVGEEWRNREGEGRQGGGLRARGEAAGGVIRVGSERCRGAERGFKIVSRS